VHPLDFVPVERPNIPITIAKATARFGRLQFDDAPTRRVGDKIALGYDGGLFLVSPFLAKPINFIVGLKFG
jgi:hypothetical protein